MCWTPPHAAIFVFVEDVDSPKHGDLNDSGIFNDADELIHQIDDKIKRWKLCLQQMGRKLKVIIYRSI